MTSEIAEQHMGLLWMLPLAGPLPTAPAARVTATFLLAAPELAEELATAMGFADAAPVLQRFERGCHCYIARVEDQLATYGWLTFDKEDIGELGLSMRLLPGEAYIWDCATLPAFRRQRLYPALLAHILKELQRSGLQRAWIGMDADNLSSQTGAALAGFQPIIDILLARQQDERRFLARGYPGVPEEQVRDAQYALFGDRNASSVAVLATK
jgi:ribosomal protein S18 acetylase RimI-like enzyme